MMQDLPDSAKRGLDLSRVGKLLVSSAPRDARPSSRSSALPNGPIVRAVRQHRGRLGDDPCGPTSSSTTWARSAANGPAAARSGHLDADGHEVPDGEVGELYRAHRLRLRRLPGRAPRRRPKPSMDVGARSATWPGATSRGYIHLVDRKSNMIISGGERTSTRARVESVLAAHPAVQDVAVGRPAGRQAGRRCTR